MWTEEPMRGMMLVLVTMVIGALAVPEDKPFQGHKVLRIHPNSSADIKSLTNLEHNLQLDFWHLPHVENDYLDVRVAPEFLQQLTDKLAELKLHFVELIQDVQSLVDRESRSIRRKRAVMSLEDYKRSYLSYNEINAFLSEVVKRTPTAELINIGSTNEQRDTYLIKLGNPSTSTKPAIFIDAGIHAREWIAPATAINFIYQLAISPDAQMTDLLGKFDFYIAPLINPDGYEYSRIDYRNRLWRKNRRQFAGTSCVGVDVNRNFGFEWNPAAGGSRQPCSDLYSGSSGFSEPESRNLRDFMLSKRPNIKGYLTLHSYGLYWLYPWGYSRTDTAEDDSTLNQIARESVNAMERSYTIGSSAQVLYVAAGGSDDFAKGAAGIPYSYTVELPPSSSNYNGFILPASQISAVADDTMKGLKAYANSVYDHISPATQRPATTSTASTTLPVTTQWQNFYNWWQHYYLG